MIAERLKHRLAVPRRAATMTLSLPVDVLESLKAIAAESGLNSRTLLKRYIAEGLRRDEAIADGHIVRDPRESVRRQKLKV